MFSPAPRGTHSDRTSNTSLNSSQSFAPPLPHTMPPLRFRPRTPSILTLSSLSTPPRRHPFHLRYPTTLHIRAITSTIPYVPTCPPDTCLCAPIPVPELDIDRKTPLLHTMAHYAQHVIVCSGKADWSSRIEDEEGAAGDFVRGMKEVIGRGGKRFDVCRYVFYSIFPIPTRRATNK
jgi:hypothetical protein